jgi:AcrR family transcriptional regulator
MAQTLSRRDRLRAATAQEIRQIARRLLVDQGAEAVSLRAIAREMGMTAPALYRYFGSHEELIRNVVADVFTELTSSLRAAIASAAAGGGDLTEQVIVACWEFRRWSLEHKREFGLLFGSPLPGVNVEKDEITAECGQEFGNTFFALILEVWRTHPFPVPPDADIDADLRAQLERYRDGLGALGAGLPLGLLLIFLRCWTRLYGTLSLEVFGHLGFALDDPEPMFELMLIDTAPLIGLQYPPR